MKILLLEDEPTVGRFLLSCMERWNMDSVLAQTPREALQILSGDRIGFLVADLMLPEMTGTELVRRLHQMDRYRDLPVLMISGKADRQAIIDANEVGIRDFLAKPFSPEELRKRILAIHKGHMRDVLKQQIQHIWNGRQTSLHDVDGAQVIFGEPISRVEDLQRPENQSLAIYLNSAREAILELNRAHSALHLGYIMKDNTADIIVPLMGHASKRWVRLILVSARCPGKPVLLARLFRINGRSDLSVQLTYDQLDDIPPADRQGLERLGVKMLKRSELDSGRLGELLSEHVVTRSRRRVKVTPDSSEPQAVRRRIMEDITAMGSLPVLPQVYERILELSRDPDSDLRDWIQVIQADPMTCAVIFRYANSPAYGFRGRITEIGRAVILLGKDMVTNIVASQAVSQSFSAVEEQGFNLGDFWLHNLAVGFAAHILAFPLDADAARATHGKEISELDLGDEAMSLLGEIDLPGRLKLDYTRENPFIGGIMHDIGKGAMVQAYPMLFPLLLSALEEDDWNSPMLTVEQTVTGGLTHTVVGDILAREWDLEEELCQVILHHHQPEIDNTYNFLTGIADILGQALYPFPRGPRSPVGQALEEGELESASQFLPAGFFDNPLLSPDEFAALAQAIAPKVRYFVEGMHRST